MCYVLVQVPVYSVRSLQLTSQLKRFQKTSSEVKHDLTAPVSCFPISFSRLSPSLFSSIYLCLSLYSLSFFPSFSLSLSFFNPQHNTIFDITREKESHSFTRPHSTGMIPDSSPLSSK